MDFLNIKKVLLSLIALCAVGVFAYFGYADYALNQRNSSLTAELMDTKAEYASTTASLKQELVRTTDERNNLAQELQTIRGQITTAGEQLKAITGAVNVLEKIRQTDPELLKKYSKVYFLNEHYRPVRLVQIDQNYVYDPNMDKWVQGDVWPFLSRLLQGAKADGIDLLVKSAYRSFDEQVAVKSSYAVVYGAGTANQFSADQGYSEHQLGTTVDFTTSALGGSFLSFKNAGAYKWLTRNAYKYGFILSYPADNGYYQSEPWHWRFVGVALATKLYEEGKHFYDLDQREIDGYLGALFDAE